MCKEEDDSSNNVPRQKKKSSHPTSPSSMPATLPTLIPSANFTQTQLNLDPLTSPHLPLNSSDLSQSLITSVLNSTLVSHVPLYQPIASKLSSHVPLYQPIASKLTPQSSKASNLPSPPHPTDNKLVLTDRSSVQSAAGTDTSTGDQVLVSFDKSNAANMTFKSRSSSCKRTMRHRTRYQYLGVPASLVLAAQDFRSDLS